MSWQLLIANLKRTIVLAIIIVIGWSPGGVVGGPGVVVLVAVKVVSNYYGY